eukprot:TRINITY_DN4731_c0_g2_i1.p1 TRINITY_DN4731_c0_g2~~TRINITY_DN4731_c0_g2_i1.p1  ORF type:complete len:204 (+),score=22.51 TRINITY_DN4731_c0_g2_i1:328-939(+)
MSQEKESGPLWSFSTSFTQTKSQQWTAKMVRFMFSPVYLWVYVFILACCIAMLIYTAVKSRVTTTYCILDSLLNALILIEFSVRLTALTPKRFFRNPLNWLDSLIIVACVTTTIVEIVELSRPGNREHGLALTGAAFVALRCIVQSGRVLLLLRSHMKRRKLSAINVNALLDDDQDDLFGVRDGDVYVDDRTDMPYVAFQDDF